MNSIWEATRWPARACLYVFSLLFLALTGQAAQALSVHLEASPLHVDPGGASTLRWRSTGAKWCYSHGVWGEGRSLQGSFDTGRLWKKTWYGITCSDGKREVSDSVTVVVRDAPPELSVSLTATHGRVAPGGSTILKWSSTGAAWCYSRGVWGSGRALQGAFDTGGLWQNTWYGITCSDGIREVSDSLTVGIMREDDPVPVIRWRAPTKNEDGTRLTDLAGYRIYWGGRSRNYSGSARLDNPNWTRYTPHHLQPGTYYVAVTALDRAGNESGYSNEIRVRIP